MNSFFGHINKRKDELNHKRLDDCEFSDDVLAPSPYPAIPSHRRFFIYTKCIHWRGWKRTEGESKEEKKSFNLWNEEINKNTEITILRFQILNLKKKEIGPESLKFLQN